MTVATVFVLLILSGLVPAAIARAKGHSFLLWWVYGTVLLVVALPHSLLAEKPTYGGGRTEPVLDRCPRCEGRLSAGAIKCRQCGHVLGRTTGAGKGNSMPGFDSPDPAADDKTGSNPAPAWDDGFARVSSMGPPEQGRARATESIVDRRQVLPAVIAASVGALILVGILSIDTVGFLPDPHGAPGDQERAESLPTSNGRSRAPTPMPPPAQNSPVQPPASRVPSVPEQTPSAIARDVPPPEAQAAEQPPQEEVASATAEEPEKEAPDIGRSDRAEASATKPEAAASDAGRSDPASAEASATKSDVGAAEIDRSKPAPAESSATPVIPPPPALPAHLERNPVDVGHTAGAKADDDDESPRIGDQQQPPRAAENREPTPARPREARPATPDEDIQAVGEVVAWLQSGLRKFGYYDGPINGRAGLRTQQAIRAYQRSRGMTAHGRIDHALILSVRRSLNENAQQSKLRR